MVGTPASLARDQDRSQSATSSVLLILLLVCHDPPANRHFYGTDLIHGRKAALLSFLTLILDDLRHSIARVRDRCADDATE